MPGVYETFAKALPYFTRPHLLLLWLFQGIIYQRRGRKCGPGTVLPLSFLEFHFLETDLCGETEATTAASEKSPLLIGNVNVYQAFFLWSVSEGQPSFSTSLEPDMLHNLGFKGPNSLKIGGPEVTELDLIACYSKINTKRQILVERKVAFNQNAGS